MTEYHNDPFQRDPNRIERNFQLAWWGTIIAITIIAVISALCN